MRARAKGEVEGRESVGRYEGVGGKEVSIKALL